jgi:L-rhamnose mutarotase
MRRVGFLLKVKEQMIDEYKRRHEAVWPEMLDAIARSGWHNYSLFMREDGLLFGYFEASENLAVALETLGAEEANTRWQEHMKGFFEAASRGTGRADENMIELQEVFHLD